MNGAAAQTALDNSGKQTAAVTLDGETLFRTAGISSLPAERRAAEISERILALAKDPNYIPGSLRVINGQDLLHVVNGDKVIFSVASGDAEIERVTASVLAGHQIRRTDEAIRQYRLARSAESVRLGAVYAAACIILCVSAAVIFLRLYRRFEQFLERLSAAHADSVPATTRVIVGPAGLWIATRNVLRIFRGIVLASLILGCTITVLSFLPWSRALARRIAQLVLDPLTTLGRGFADFIPNLIFLVVLFLTTRLALKFVGLFFGALGSGRITLSDFEPEWVAPTDRLVRLSVIGLALVIAYPYLPGSGSDAFKGISLFVGVVISIGSSAVAANIIAGYALIYRRAYKVGNRVKIGDLVGEVEEISLQVTNLRSLKNERIVIPNSVVLSSSVVNYSSMIDQRRLILHTTVGIGYEVPWRQVESMLLLAAQRTSELLTDPPPYVRHRKLGDFAVEYEINAYCDQPHMQEALYTKLHRNILDVFNEYGVQIMTPAYEGDTKELKIVPAEKWFDHPAELFYHPEAVHAGSKENRGQ